MTEQSLAQTLSPFADEDAARRCDYVSKRGKSCTKTVASDEQFCVLHGASVERAADQVKRRLVALQEKSLTVLEDILVAGYDDKTRLAAVLAVLDRTGLGPKSTLEVKDIPDDLSKLSREDLARRAEAAAARLRAVNKAQLQNPESDEVTH